MLTSKSVKSNNEAFSTSELRHNRRARKLRSTTLAMDRPASEEGQDRVPGRWWQRMPCPLAIYTRQDDR